MSTSALRILIADDHAIVRDGLRRLLEASGDGWLTDEACTASQALELLRRQPFDVAVVDLSMPGMSGLELIRRVHAEFPRLGVVVLSLHAEEQYALRAFGAGANGYVVKDSAAVQLPAAVLTVVAGGAYASPELTRR